MTETAQINTDAATSTNAAAPVVTPTLLGGDTTKPVTEPTGDVTKPVVKDEVKAVTYGDFKLPEGFKSEDIGEAVTLAKDLGLTQEQAQKLIDYETKQVEEAKKADAEKKKSYEEGKQKMRQTWYDQVIKDKEIGGDKFKEALPIINKARVAFATPELTSFLETTGLGNHPELVKLFYQIGKRISEDKIHMGGNEGGKQKTQAEKLYSAK
jgi:hypothetical protein